MNNSTLAIISAKENACYDDFMDEECIDLCNALNSLEGIETYESCCGHCKNRYLVFFKAYNFESLGILYRCIDRRYSNGEWEILLDGTDTCPSNCFMLRSKKEYFKNKEEMNVACRNLIDSIKYWSSPQFKEYFKKK